MARFDIYQPSGLPAKFVVDVQADLLSDIDSRVVIPLQRIDAGRKEAVHRLKPALEINGQEFVLVTTDLGMVPSRILGSAVGNIEAEHRDTITAAMDFLFQGY